MAEVIFSLADEDGKVRMCANFEGGFDPKSPAHVSAKMMLQVMDEMQAKEAAQADRPLVLLN